MFKEILYITPKLAAGELNQMERTLSSRFSNVAKKFGKGLFSVLKGGGIAGIAMTLVDKFVNPLKETQDAIDRVLKRGDDLATYSKQFGTSTGKLAWLQGMAQSTGLDSGTLYTLLEKYQSALAEAKADPSKPTAVRNYVGDKDIVESFFQFVQSMKKLPTEKQVLMQEEVFGQKFILKMSDFVQTDFAAQAKKLGGPSVEEMTKAYDKLGALNDLSDTLAAQREMYDAVKKASVITETIVRQQNEKEKLDLAREQDRIKNYDAMAAVASTTQTIANTAESILLGVGKLIDKVGKVEEGAAEIAKSRYMRGVPGNMRER